MEISVPYESHLLLYPAKGEVECLTGEETPPLQEN